MALVAITVCAITSTNAVSAVAGGSPTIAGAPTIVAGQLQFGNLAQAGSDGALVRAVDPDIIGDLYLCNSASNEEFWTANLVAGDLVRWQVDGQGQPLNFAFLPAGTSDFSAPKGVDAIGHSHITQTPFRDEGSFVANRTGSIPVIACNLSPTPGPFSFTAFVTHAVVLSMPKRHTIRRAGTLRVAVSNPDGRPIVDQHLTITISFGSHKLGTAHPVKGAARVKYKVPKALTYGRTLPLTVRATGASYRTKSLGAGRVTLKR
jgi:hypothetical protein